MPTRATKPAVMGINPSLASHLHPIIVLTAYILQFHSLVESPSSTLFTSLPVLTAIQVAYAVLCLDGFSSGDGSLAYKKSRVGGPRPGAGGKLSSGGSGGLGDFVLPVSLSLLLSCTLGTTVIYIMLVLFGAPFTTHIPHTILAAAHISLLICFPLVYVHKLDGQKWKQIFAFLTPIDEVFGASVGAMIGAWCGAMPIPLDWDEPWQKWPVTILTGAYLGYVAGKFGGMYIFTGKKLVF